MTRLRLTLAGTPQAELYDLGLDGCVLIGLSLYRTVSVMAPVFEQIYNDAYVPFSERRTGVNEALERASGPLRDRYRETILAWDEPTRWAYRVDESADALIDALVEEWVVEGDGDRSTVRWTFAVEPGSDMEAAIPAAKTMIGDMFDQAMANLSARLAGVRG